MLKKLHFLTFYDVMLEYICAKNIYVKTYLKWKSIQEMIEMIFNFYEIFNIY
jgi:hypothetical protein